QSDAGGSVASARLSWLSNGFSPERAKTRPLGVCWTDSPIFTAAVSWMSTARRALRAGAGPPAGRTPGLGCRDQPEAEPWRFVSIRYATVRAPPRRLDRYRAARRQALSVPTWGF